MRGYFIPCPRSVTGGFARRLRCITYDDLAETFDRRLKKMGEFGQKNEEEPVPKDIEESNKPLAPDHYSAPAP